MGAHSFCAITLMCNCNQDNLCYNPTFVLRCNRQCSAVSFWMSNILYEQLQHDLVRTLASPWNFPHFPCH